MKILKHAVKDDHVPITTIAVIFEKKGYIFTFYCLSMKVPVMISDDRADVLTLL